MSETAPEWVDCLPAAADWLARAYPAEGCGLILHNGAGYRFLPCPNLAPSHRARTSYVLDPLEVVRAEDRGERLIAIVHSHCDAADHFSLEDRDGALLPAGPSGDRDPAFPGVDYLVISVTAAGPRSAALHRFDGAFRAVWSRRV